MSRTKAQLVERAENLGIKNAADIPYDQLADTIRDIQAGGALARAATKQRSSKTSTKRKAIQRAAASKSTKNPNATESGTHAVRQEQPIRTSFRVTFYMDQDSAWRWNLKSANGKIMADSSEGYITRWGCKRAFKKAIGF